MGACQSAPSVAEDELELGGGVSTCLAPGPEHVIARFKNQDVAALATKYMPKDALTVSATTATTTTMLMPAAAAAAPQHRPQLISSAPSPPSAFHHLPPLALGALGDNSLDDEPGARTPGRAPTLTPPTLSQAPPSHLPRHCELAYAPPYIPPPGLFPAGGGGGSAAAASTSASAAAPASRQQRDDSSWRPSRRRAVFVAVGSGPLGFPGAVSDAECVRRALARAFGFSPEETIFLHDGNSGSNNSGGVAESENENAPSATCSPPRPNPQLRRLLPTRNNIMASARWLVSGARAGDSLVFAFFGRGGNARGRPFLGGGGSGGNGAAAAESGISTSVVASAHDDNNNDSDEEDSATSASPSGRRSKKSEKDTATSGTTSNAAAFFLRPASADAAAAAPPSSSSPQKNPGGVSDSSSLPSVAATLLPCDAVSAAARAAAAQPSSSSSAATAALFVGRTAAAAAAAAGASSAAAISSADLRAALVDPLPAGARLLVLVDAAGDGSGSCPKGFGLNLPARAGHRPDGWPCWESAAGISSASSGSGKAPAAPPPSSSAAAASTGGGEVVLISGCCEQPQRAPTRKKKLEEGGESEATTATGEPSAAPLPFSSSSFSSLPPLGGDLAFALVQALEQGHGSSVATLSRAMRYAVRNGGRGNDASSASVASPSADGGNGDETVAAALAAATPPAPPTISATRRFDLWRPLAL